MKHCFGGRGAGPVTEPVRRARLGRLGGWLGIVCNLLLALAKLLAGLWAGSVSIVADGLNNAGDATSGLVTLWGFRLARQPADRDHPFGHARYEYLAGLAVSALILAVGWELALSSVKRIFTPAPLTVSALTVGILCGSLILKLAMALFYRHLVKLTGSLTLRATATDCRNDALATGVVLICSLLEAHTDWKLDGLAGLGVALFILYSGIRSVQATAAPLLGRRADPVQAQRLKELILSQEKILGVHDLIVHDYGPGQYYASAHAEVSAREDPLVCHDLIDAIERRALEQLRVNLVIHYDPVETDDRELEQLRSLVAQTVQELDGQLSVHDLRLVRGRQTRLVFDLAAPYGRNPAQLKEQVDRALESRGVTYPTTIHFDGQE